MKSFYKFATTIFLIFVLSNVPVFSQDSNEGGVERYAIFAGSNEGGKNNQKLLYAGSDAIAFQKTMTEVGGISKTNGILLLDPSKDDLDEAMENISAMIKRNQAKSKRSEFLFYYSGHSDENSLLLGKTSYDYSSLKASISRVPSDVHVVILDSCYSGNFIRTKGGQKKKPFLFDDSSVVKGHAYLSSSSSQEFSQESDEIGSSFFTNAMLTGLRGAADSSGDKKVTLNELYSYAFSETLSKTQNTQAGPQHPNYNITLVGSGDLVLSDISSYDSIVLLPSDLDGRVIIRDSNKKLVSEINKIEGTPVFLALEKGEYNATVIAEKETLQGNFNLDDGKIYEVSSSSLRSVKQTVNRVRGIEDTADDLSQSEEEDNDIAFIPADFSFVCNEFSIYLKKDISTCFALGLIRTRVEEVNGAIISGIGSEANTVNGMQTSGIYSMSGKKVNGVQNSGIISIANSVTGAQLAGIINAAQEAEGVQIAGIFNTVKSIKGGQISGIANVSRELDGVQVAGIVNVSKDVTNRGFQVGLINIADKLEGYQIGLINYSRTGVFETGFSYTSNNTMRAVLNSGNRHIYTVIGIAASPKNFMEGKFSTKDNKNVLIAGLGSRLEIGKFNFDFEIQGNLFGLEIEKDETKTEEEMYNVDLFAYPSGRVCAGFTPVKHIKLFAGLICSFETKENSKAFEKSEHNKKIKIDDELNIYPEIEAGICFSLN